MGRLSQLLAQIGGIGAQAHQFADHLGSWQPLAAPLERNDARYGAIVLEHLDFLAGGNSPQYLGGVVAKIASGYRSRHATSVAELLSRRLVSMSAVTISAGYGRCCARSRPRWWARRGRLRARPDGGRRCRSAVICSKS